MVMSDKAKRNKFVAGLRQLYSWYWPPKKELILRERIQRRRNGKTGWYCMCCKCGLWFPVKEIKVDHIVPVGAVPDLISGQIGPYADKIFCDISNLQLLCKECHDAKTLQDNKLTREFRRNGKETKGSTD